MKICRYCKQEFMPIHQGRIYCSVKCRNREKCTLNSKEIKSMRIKKGGQEPENDDGEWLDYSGYC